MARRSLVFSLGGVSLVKGARGWRDFGFENVRRGALPLFDLRCRYGSTERPLRFVEYHSSCRHIPSGGKGGKYVLMLLQGLPCRS